MRDVDGSPDGPEFVWTNTYYRPGVVTFTTSPHGLVVSADEPDLDVYANSLMVSKWEAVPGSVADSAYRELEQLKMRESNPASAALRPVGFFDPGAITVGSPLSQVPLETYRSNIPRTADDATAALLGSREFLPNLNPADYSQLQPSLLMSLANLDLVDPRYVPGSDLTAPLTAVRVRVADVVGTDEASQERIRRVAELIALETGLDVDITIGSSLIEEPITLTQTFDRPDLHLTEMWTVKGVALRVVEEIDTKSASLFALILASCALTVLTIAGAATRAQRTDMGILTTLGQPPRRIAELLLLQWALIGLAAGVAGALLAIPIAAVAGLQMSLWRALVAIPIAVLLMVLASLPAVRRVSRQLPTTLLRPVVRTRGRSARASSAYHLGAAALLRRPARLAAAALSIALAIAAVAVLLTLARMFQSAVTDGTLLGDAIAVQVRTPDVIAAVVLALLGIIGLMLTLTFGILEDAPDWAALRATGWRSGQVVRAVLAQGFLIAVLGALLGTLLALWAVTALTGAPLLQPLTEVLTMAGVGLAVTVLVSLAPARHAATRPITAGLEQP